MKAVYAYDPFGCARPDLTTTTSGWDSRLRFQLARQDETLGVYTLGPRLLDPSINRFVGADFYVAAAANMQLAVDPLTGNRYVYAGANPAGMIDDGHSPKGPRCRSKPESRNIGAYLRGEICAPSDFGVETRSYKTDVGWRVGLRQRRLHRRVPDGGLYCKHPRGYYWAVRSFGGNMENSCMSRHSH